MAQERSHMTCSLLAMRLDLIVPLEQRLLCKTCDFWPQSQTHRTRSAFFPLCRILQAQSQEPGCLCLTSRPRDAPARNADGGQGVIFGRRSRLTSSCYAGGFFFFTLFLIGPTEKPTRDFTRAPKIEAD